ncbi:MAG: hypothetical protein WCP09_02580 [Candidatus Taylorbacteria bacterium]
MYVIISIFYISLIGIIIMPLLKRHEVKTGKATIVNRLGRGTDHIFQHIFTSVRKAISYVNKKTFIALAQWIAYHILFHIRKVYVDLKHLFISNPHGKKLIDAVRGRGDVKDHGASFYLRRISDR